MPFRLLALAVLGCIALPAAGAHAEVPNPRDGELKSMCRQINSFRAMNGVAPMTMSFALGSAAGWMSSDMANRNYLDHTDSLGRSYSLRLAQFGGGYWTAENIAAGSVDAFAIMSLWKSSPAHRANLLNASYSVMGVARAYNASSAYGAYWVADFGASLIPGAIC